MKQMVVIEIHRHHFFKIELTKVYLTEEELS